MKILTTVADIQKAIASIAKRGKQLDMDIHVAGVSCLRHASECGDTTVLDSLVNAMPKGSRKQAFCEWALAFGQVRMLDRSVKKDAEAIKQGRMFALDRERTYDEEGAIARSWTEFKPEPDLLTTFDLGGAVAALTKKYQKAANNGATIEGREEAIKYMEAMLSNMKQGMEV